jgi:nucleoside recognition membrane protein YjiH
MYKHNKKMRLEKSKQPILWVRRKVILIITAFMIGMSNGLNAEDNMINGNQNHTEQQHKKD